MNKILLKQQLTPFEADYARWCAEQGALLREGRLSDLDRDNLAEEIESLGRSDRREIESRLKVLLVHLLKWYFQPEQRAGSWKSTIFEQRSRIARIVKESPSLRSHPRQALADEYAIARLEAAGETRLDETVFPEDCPFSIQQVLDAQFFPE